MDRKEYTDSDYYGKIRSKSTKKFRNNPYKNPKKNEAKQNDKIDQGLLGKVSTYIIPSWLTGWWSQEKQTTEEEEYSSEDELNNEAQTTSQKCLQSTSHEINHNAVVPDLIASSSASSVTVNLKPDLFKKVVSKDNYQFKETASTINISSEDSKAYQSILNTKKVNVSSKDKYFSQLSNYGDKVISKSEINKIDNDLAIVPNETMHQGRQPLTLNKTARFSTSNLKKPSFKVSAFVPPNKSQDSTNLNMSLNSSSFDFSVSNKSLFYSGQTVYGGSSAMRDKTSKRQKLSPVSNRVRTTRTQIKAKPLKRISKKKAVTSDTAKRILTTLDKMSSPLKDARQIPALRSYKPSLSEQLRKTNVIFNKRQPNKAAPPVTGLNKDSSFVSDKSYFKRTDTNNQNTSDSNTFANIPKLSQISKPVVEVTDQITSKSSMKMKRDKTTNHYTTLSQNCELEIVNTMPDVTKPGAPLVVNSLPKFNFHSKPMSSISVMPAFTPIPKAAKQESKVVVTPIGKSCIYNFAKPGVKSKTSLMSTPSTAIFSFSNPIAVDETSNRPKVQKSMDILVSKEKKSAFASKFENKKGSWDCSTCMITNKENATVCAACISPKPNTTGKSVESPAIIPVTVSKSTRQFSKQLTQSLAKSWECPTCMINNKESDLKCLACTENKPENSSKVLPVKPTVQNVTATLKSFKNMKPVEPGWDCPTCLITNKLTDNKCVACTEQKPEIKVSKKFNSFFSNQNKDTWECPTCMISNKNAILLCIACSEQKPGSSKQITFGQTKNEETGKSTSSTISFGIPVKSNMPTGFSFGKPQEITTPSTLSFGIQKPELPATSFSFGKITDTTKEKGLGSDGNFASGISFGNSNKESDLSIPNFSFGKPKETNAPTQGFSFGKPEESNKPTVSLGDSIKESKIPPPTQGFSFGNLNENKTASADVKTQDVLALKNSLFTTNVLSHTGSQESSIFSTGTQKETKLENIFSVNSDSNKISFNQESKTTPSTGFSFGQASRAESTNSIAFGVTQDKNSNTTAGFLFGQSTKMTNIPNDEPNSEFSFGKPDNTTSSNGFTFGQINTGTDLTKKAVSISNSLNFKVPSFNEKISASPAAAHVQNSTKELPFNSIEEAAAAGFLKVPGVGNSSSNNNNKTENTAILANNNPFIMNKKEETQITNNFNFKSTPLSQGNDKPHFNFHTDSSIPLFNASASTGLFNSSSSDTMKPPSFNFTPNAEPATKKVSFEQPVHTKSNTASFNFGSSQLSNPFATTSSTATSNAFNFASNTAPSFMSPSVPSFMTDASKQSNESKSTFGSTHGFNFNAPSIPTANTNGQLSNANNNMFSMGAQSNPTGNGNVARRQIRRAARRMKK